jgi:hypothetical protein
MTKKPVLQVIVITHAQEWSTRVGWRYLNDFIVEGREHESWSHADHMTSLQLCFAFMYSAYQYPAPYSIYGGVMGG